MSRNHLVETVVPSNAAEASKSGILTRLSHFAKRAAGILGFSAVTGVAAAYPTPGTGATDPAFSQTPAPTAPAPEAPSVQASETRSSREWKTVSKNGIGAEDFAVEAFGSKDWNLLVDEKGRRLTDPAKLRLGGAYLLAKDAADAKLIRQAIRGMTGESVADIPMPPEDGSADVKSETVSTARSERTQSAEVPKPATYRSETATFVDVTNQGLASRTAFVRAAEEHMGKPYRMGGSGASTIDCSQLVVEAMKAIGAAEPTFDTTAAGLKSAFSVPKKRSEAKYGDLVYLTRNGKTTHVAISLGMSVPGYVDILDASSSTGKVTKRKLPINLAGLSIAEPKFLGGSIQAPDAVPTATMVAQADVAEKPVAVKVRKSKSAKAERVAQAPVQVALASPAKKSPSLMEQVVTSTLSVIASDAHAEERPAAVKPMTAKKISKPIVSVARKVSKPVSEEIVSVISMDGTEPTFVPAAEEAPPALKMSERLESVPAAANEPLASVPAERVAVAATVPEPTFQRASFRSVDPVVELMADVAANDESFSQAQVPKSVELKRTVTKLKDERKVVEKNIGHYVQQAHLGVAGASSTLTKLQTIASVLDVKISNSETKMYVAMLEEKQAEIRTQMAEIRSNLRSGNEGVVIGNVHVINGAASQLAALSAEDRQMGERIMQLKAKASHTVIASNDSGYLKAA